MRFYNQSHRFYCGVDLHARSMYLCLLDHAGAIVLHKELPAEPAAFLDHALYMKAIHGGKSKSDHSQTKPLATGFAAKSRLAV